MRLPRLILGIVLVLAPGVRMSAQGPAAADFRRTPTQATQSGTRGTTRSSARRTRLGVAPTLPPTQGGYLTTEQIARSAPISFSGSHITLRQALGNLSAAIHLAILLDRRIDPEKLIDVDLNQVPLPDALARIAAAAGAGQTLVGPVAYFGPPESARDLRTLCALRRAEAEKLPKAERDAVLKTAALAWPALETPTKIVARLAAAADIAIVGEAKLPHDLLAPANLPPLPWVDRLSLVLVQFRQTFRFASGGSKIELIPIPNVVQLERTYPGGRDAATAVERWKSLAPAADISIARGRIVVRGRVEDHDLIMPPREPKAVGVQTPGQQVYTLKMENVPLDGFLAQLSEKLGRDIKLDRPALTAAGIKPDRALSVDVTGVSLDELLRAALKPLGLRHDHVGPAITVTVDGR